MSGGRQVGDSVDSAVLCVGGGGGGGGGLGAFWRKLEQVLVIPEVTGLHWATSSSSNGSSTGGARGQRE